MSEEPPRETDEDRLRFILEGQRHCDHYLTPLAEPRGKSVLVVGAGAGTEILWCLRNGAREVVGIDILEQRQMSLDLAVEKLGLQPVPLSILRLSIEEARALDRRFDLVLSNNVFEHVTDLARAFAACAELVEPGTGRIALFTAPLYYSSSGSHLPAEPWEHLWEAPSSLRQRLLAALPPRHPLQDLELRDYLDREISLNRMRLADLLAAVATSGLVVLNLRLVRDRRVQDLPTYLDRLAPALREEAVTVADLALEGVGLELMRLGESALAEQPIATEEIRLSRHGYELGERIAGLEHRIRELEADNEQLRETVAEVKRVLDAVAASWSFRFGRLLTAPARWVWGRWR
ncbi:MAG TPA: class I SAM-dependent methyltransferase [Thermoanaerobaculia bacterium]|nr:class I SAM-dependent methyltransferase [Thermoanaerobaculia bacterium]